MSPFQVFMSCVVAFEIFILFCIINIPIKMSIGNLQKNKKQTELILLSVFSRL